MFLDCRILAVNLAPARLAKAVTLLSLLSGLILPVRAASPAKSDLESQILEVIRQNPEVILESLSRYQQRQEKAKLEQRAGLVRAIGVSPAQYVADSPVFGRQSAKKILFVFADFQCPYCAQVRGALQDFVLSHPDVSLVYKHYPLTEIHPQAMAAAMASWAAQQQGKFWQFHDILYAHQDRLGDDLYLKAAKELGLNIAKFNADRASSNASAGIKRDLELAEGLGLSGTPFFLLNGQTFSGVVDADFLRKQL